MARPAQCTQKVQKLIRSQNACNYNTESIRKLTGYIQVITYSNVIVQIVFLQYSHDIIACLCTLLYRKLLTD